MPSQSSRPQLGPSQIYLMIYNTVCAFLWLRILVLVISTLFSPADKDITEAYINLEPWTRCAQTLAVAEIVHAATGKDPTLKSIDADYVHTLRSTSLAEAANAEIGNSNITGWDVNC